MDPFRLIYIQDKQTPFLVSQSLNMKYESSFYKQHILMPMVLILFDYSSYKHNKDNSIALLLDFNIKLIESIQSLIFTLSIIILLKSFD